MTASWKVFPPDVPIRDGEHPIDHHYRSCRERVHWYGERIAEARARGASAAELQWLEQKALDAGNTGD